MLPAVHLRLGPARSGAVSLVTALVLGAVLGLGACRSPASHIAGSVQASPGPGEAFAVWPEETPEEAEAAAERLADGEDPWRADPVETALVFARRALGWAGGEAVAVQEQPGGLTLVEVRREPGGPSISVRLAQLVGGRWWSVYNAWGTVERDPAVTVRDGQVEIRFDMEEASSAAVTVEYGDLRLEETVRSPGPVRMDLGTTPDTPGYFLVALMDASGRVFDVVSSPLPAGDFAAG